MFLTNSFREDMSIYFSNKSLRCKAIKGKIRKEVVHREGHNQAWFYKRRK
jgi:hypothetical protein